MIKYLQLVNTPQAIMEALDTAQCYQSSKRFIDNNVMMDIRISNYGVDVTFYQGFSDDHSGKPIVRQFSFPAYKTEKEIHYELTKFIRFCESKSVLLWNGNNNGGGRKKKKA